MTAVQNDRNEPNSLTTRRHQKAKEVTDSGEVMTKAEERTGGKQRQSTQKDKWASSKSSSNKIGPKMSAKEVNKKIRNFMDEMFPDLEHNAYFVPPITFNVSKRILHPAFRECFLYCNTPQSNTRADEVRERVLSVLREALPIAYRDQAAFVLSGVTFEDYLNKPLPQDPAHPQEKVKTLSLPKPDDMAPQYRRGEMEVLIVLKDYGIVILDIKAVGDTFKEINANEEEQIELVHKVLEKALALMRKEKEVVLHLVNDILCTVPVRTLLALPNLNRQTLKKALDSNPQLKQELEKRLKSKRTVEELCLCSDDLPAKHTPLVDQDLQRFLQWWLRNYPTKSDTLTKDVYLDIVGRFVGPFSTVSVWTAQLPRAEVRTLGQAICETAKRFSTFALLPSHVGILESRDPLVWLVGPPGAGKTVLLVLKGLEWVREGGKYVCVLTLQEGPSPVALWIVQQIQRRLKSSKSSKEQPREIEMDTVLQTGSSVSPHQECKTLVDRLKARAAGRQVCLIMDSVDSHVVPVIEEILSLLNGPGDGSDAGQDCLFWCAGNWLHASPSGFTRKELTVPIRRPPAIQVLLQMVDPYRTTQDALASEVTMTSPRTEHRYMTYSTQTTEDHPLPTTGVPVKLISHDGHGKDPVMECAVCAQVLGDYLRMDLGTGEHKDIQFKDVLILTAQSSTSLQEYHHSHQSIVFVGALEKRLGVKVEVVAECGGNQNILAFPPEDKILLTTTDLVNGLERKVVVFLPEGSPSPGNRDDPSTSPESSDHDPDKQADFPHNTTSPEMSGNEDNVRCTLNRFQNRTVLEDETDSGVEDLYIENASDPEDDDDSSDESGDDDTVGTTNAESFHTQLRRAVGQLNAVNRERMWQAVSRTLGHAIIIHFQNE